MKNIFNKWLAIISTILLVVLVFGWFSYQSNNIEEKDLLIPIEGFTAKLTSVKNDNGIYLRLGIILKVEKKDHIAVVK